MSTQTMRILTSPFTVLKSLVLFNPIVTGGLLYILIKGPDSARDTLVRTARVEDAAAYFNMTTEAFLATSAKVLKWLFAIGLVTKINKYLSSFALNNWRLTPGGTPYNWTAGKELVCITGGSSGFGALMVKRFVEKVNVRIVVIDVQDLPKDLAARKSSVCCPNSREC